jgi:Spy/CpxP family protein refolding chaperone
MQPGFGEHRSPVERELGSQGKSGRWWNDPGTVEKLKLTDVQRKSMDDVLLEHREKLVDLRGSLEKAELEMEPMMGGDQPNEAKILAQIDKVAQARAELEKANARFLLAIRAKLTPEQWKLLQSERTERERRQRDSQGRDGQGRDGQGMDRQGQGGMMMNHHQQAPSGQSAPQGPGPQGAAPQGTAPQDSGAPPPQQ